MTQKSAKLFMAKYRCRGCLHEFSFSDHVGSSVRCPRCKSGACDPLTPAANVYVGSSVASVREGKLKRYEERSAKMLRKYQEHIKIFLTFLEVLEVSKDTKSRVSNVLNESLEEAKQIQKDRIAMHESRAQ